MASLSLVDQALDGVDKQWRKLLINDLDKILSNIDFKKSTPIINLIFTFARLTQLTNISVVIIGQDPYHTLGEAHGLAFSSLKSIPPSLKNIYKCLVNCNEIESLPTTGDLTAWAKQGVLLLNCALTTEIGMANAHAELWREYIDRLIHYISKLNKNAIWLLWGNFAKSKKPLITGKILEYAHPSPLAQRTQPFIDCDHFTTVNKLLKDPICWDPLVEIIYEEEDCEKYKDCENENKEVIKFDISKDIIKKFEIVDCNTSVVFTDGSCNPNKRCPEAIGSYAACFSIGKLKDIILYGKIDNTIHYASNQRAEGTAISTTLQYLLNNLDKWSNCIIVSDSDFWIKMFTIYMPQWDRNNIDFGSKQNSDMTVSMYNMYKLLTMEHNRNIEFRHIKSHNKNKWESYPADSYEYFCYLQNDYVDKLAEFARESKKIANNTHIVGVVPSK
jgi:uracil-DNA glycosylase